MAKQHSIILDDDDALPTSKRDREPRESSRTGYEWGLASTIIGAVFLVLGPLTTLVLVVLTREAAIDYSHQSDSSKVELIGLLGIVSAEIVAITGFFFGLRGLTQARADRSPAALPITGILLCLAAVILWLLVAFVTMTRG